MEPQIIDEIADFTAEDAEKLAQYLADAPAPPNRAQRRANTRALRKASSQYIRKHQLEDAKLIVRRKAILRRRYGNPKARREALIQWFVLENAKRGYE